MKLLVKILKNKKGFTLIELITVISILVILIAILGPSLSGYVNDADKTVDQANLAMLNRVTQAHVVRNDLYNADAFSDLGSADSTTNTQRLQKLVDENYLSRVPVAKQSGKSFTWNVSSQIWTLGDGESTPPEDTSPPESTEPTDSHPPTVADEADNIPGGRNKGNLTDGSYTVGDYVTYQGQLYKVVMDISMAVTNGWLPGKPGLNFWKKISESYDENSRYEQGDVISYNGKFYRSTTAILNVWNPTVTSVWQEVEDNGDGTWRIA